MMKWTIELYFYKLHEVVFFFFIDLLAVCAQVNCEYGTLSGR